MEQSATSGKQSGGVQGNAGQINAAQAQTTRSEADIARSNQRRRLFLIIGALAVLLLLCILLWLQFIGPIINPPTPPPAGLNANPGGPHAVGEGQTLTFDGSGSTGSNITTYNWDFGDGNMGSGVAPSHTYQDGPNQYTVNLTVANDRGQTSSNSTQVTVNNLPPTANAGGPYSCALGETITLAGSCNDPSPVDAASLTCTWADFSGAALSEPSYTCPTTPGEVTVILTAIDKDGGSAQASAPVIVGPTSEPNQPPVAVIVVYLRDKDGLTFGFDGSSSSDPDPEGKIVTYEWNFGDEKTETGVKVTHTYAEEGNYTVTLTVTDDQGATGSTTVNIP